MQQRITSCLDVMDYFMKQSNPVVASMVVAEKRSGSTGGGTIVDTVANILGNGELYFGQAPKFIRGNLGKFTEIFQEKLRNIWLFILRQMEDKF